MHSDDDRRRQILAAAERLLCHYGPGKTTMAEIAREASIGVGTVYLEFTSKDAIVEELSRLRHASVLDAMRAAAVRESATFAARLSATIDAKIEALLRLADQGTHAVDLVHCGKSSVQSALARFMEEERALVENLLREGARAREFTVPDPAVAAATVLAAYASFAPPWLYRHPRDQTMRALRAMHDLVLHGLIARANDPRANKPRR